MQPTDDGKNGASLANWLKGYKKQKLYNINVNTAVWDMQVRSPVTQVAPRLALVYYIRIIFKSMRISNGGSI